MPFLYLHIPFCRHRCAYCDFNTYAGQESLIPAYVDALCREIEFVGLQTTELPNYPTTELPNYPTTKLTNYQTTETIFFGGGTPSLLEPRHFEKILQTIHEHFNIPSNAETSLEANPGTVTLASLRELRALGFNRISFGMQSANPDELRQLGRIHDAGDVLASVAWARQAGFENLNLDLIFGLPEQPLDRWQATVRQAVSLCPEHLSLYALTIEPRTPFGRLAERRQLPLPDPDLAAEMYEWAGDFLESQGYIQYEISNWAKDVPGFKGQLSRDECSTPRFACQHNLQTWRNRPYLGFGAGAHGYASGVRYSNVLRIKTYIERCHLSLVPRHSSRVPRHSSPVSRPLFPLSPVVVNHHSVSIHEQMQETMMLGLRLTREGVSANVFYTRFGVQMEDVFGNEIEELTGLGLLEWVPEKNSEVLMTSEVLRLTKRGRLLGNQVFMRFVD